MKQDALKFWKSMNRFHPLLRIFDALLLNKIVLVDSVSVGVPHSVVLKILLMACFG